MKRIIFLLTTIFICTCSYAKTINLHWLNDNGTTYTESTCTVDDDLIIPTTPPTKYGYTFTGWEFLPFVPLEYIESTGTQYIDTGLTVNNGDITATAVFMPTKFLNIEYSCIFGANGNFQAGYTASGNAHIGNAGSRNKYFNRYTKVIVSGILSSSVAHTYYVDNVSTGLARIFNTNKEILLFNAVNGGGYPAVGRFFSFTAIRDNQTIMDLIPVLDGDGTPCMYDLVEGKFYYNAGTGQFIAGPVIGGD